MNLSIIIAVLNSQEIMRRQILNWKKCDFPDNVEIIIMDDGSVPPLAFDDCGLKNFKVIPTNDFRPWTVGIARNLGAKLCDGDYIFMTDIDYIITKQAVELALTCTEDRMACKRKLGILDEDGNLSQEYDTLLKWGVSEERLSQKGTYLPPHPNSFIMKKDTYWMLGGYDEVRIARGYPTNEDNDFKRKWARVRNAGKVTSSPDRPVLYMFPNGQFCGDIDSNPFGMFHGLTRKV